MTGDEGILLLDHFDEMAELLVGSFRRAGFQGPAVALSEETDLPEGVESVFRLASRDGEPCPLPGSPAAAQVPGEAEVRSYRLAHAGWEPGHTRYFDQIEMPDLWEVAADGASGRVLDRGRLRARVYYARAEASRVVGDVDWLDEAGTPRFTDHYDLEGRLCARTTFNGRGQRFCRTWFDGLGRERVVENYVTGDVIVARDGRVRHFANRTELAVDAIRALGLEGQRVFYNSLSTPLFVSERLRAHPRGNVLFWQEPPRDDVPGNMRMILDGRSRTSEILVQDARSCERLLSLGASADYVRPLGFVYGFERENAGTDEVLICTNSDQVESLEALVRGLPEMRFHIAAVTEMSSRLLSFGAEENVVLHPVASREVLARLFRSCDWYLDVNYGTEVRSAVRRAFLADQLVLGLRQTLHRPRFMCPEHVLDDAEGLVALVRELRGSRELLRHHLDLQRKAALAEGPEAYRRLFRDG